MDGARAAERGRNIAFVKFQALFWGLFLALRTAAAAQLHPDLFLTYMGPRFAIVCAYAAGTTIIHLIVARFADWSPNRRLLLALALCAILTAPLHAIEGWFSSTTPPAWPAGEFLDYVTQFGWVLLAWAGYYFARDHAFQIERQSEAMARVQALAHAAQLKMLRYQLNPHFLFNSLNAVSTLVLEKRNAQAEAMLMHLSRFLRHTIEAEPHDFTTVIEEASLQKLYLAIEAERFGERLQIRCEIPAELEDCLVPSLLIQPAVENAIKHGVAQITGVGRVRIAVSQNGNRLITIIEDNGPGPIEPAQAGGLGLRNARARLAALYGGDARLTLERRAEGGARTTFDVPLRRAG